MGVAGRWSLAAVPRPSRHSIVGRPRPELELAGKPKVVFASSGYHLCLAGANESSAQILEQRLVKVSLCGAVVAALGFVYRPCGWVV